MMIAAGDIKSLPARNPWPMHRALRELHDEAGRRGLRTAAGLELSFKPCPESGLAAQGADDALRMLVRTGLLAEVGTLSSARLAVDNDLLVRHRRRLMSLQPSVVALLQRAGSRWDALAAMSSKNLVARAASPSSMVASRTA